MDNPIAPAGGCPSCFGSCTGGVVEMLVKFNVAEIVVALVMVHAREIVRQHVIPVALAVAHIIVPTIVRLGLDG